VKNDYRAILTLDSEETRKMAAPSLKHLLGLLLGEASSVIRSCTV